MQFSPIRGCFSQMFVLQKEFLFARGLNWDQSCLWKTPPSHFLLFSPLACPYFFNFFSSPDFWGVKEAPCKNLYVFGENWQRNQFPKLTTFLLHFSPMSPLCHSALCWHWICPIIDSNLSCRNEPSVNIFTSSTVFPPITLESHFQWRNFTLRFSVAENWESVKPSSILLLFLHSFCQIIQYICCMLYASVFYGLAYNVYPTFLAVFVLAGILNENFSHKI